MPKLHVKKGDQVLVIAGKDKGAKGRVIQTLPEKDRVVVEGVNMIKRHSKENLNGPRGAKQGGVETLEAPIHVSNVKKLKDEEKPAKKTDKKADEKADESGEDA